MTVADWLDPIHCPVERPPLARMGRRSRELHDGIDDHIRSSGVPYLHPESPTLQLDMLSSKQVRAWQESKAQFLFMGDGCWSQLPHLYARYGTTAGATLIERVRELEAAPDSLGLDEFMSLGPETRAARRERADYWRRQADRYDGTVERAQTLNVAIGYAPDDVESWLDLAQTWGWVGNHLQAEASLAGAAAAIRRFNDADYDVPVVSHEIGQWCVFPNLDEIPKYSGPLKPRNFEIVRDMLEAQGMIDQARDFFMASGKLQTICYKEEIEAALRTPGFGGFQLLDLHDFPGQGTALVGMLDPFWEPKDYVNADAFRQFCASTVPLVGPPPSPVPESASQDP